jgi:hypothetical protein
MELTVQECGVVIYRRRLRIYLSRAFGIFSLLLLLLSKEGELQIWNHHISKMAAIYLLPRLNIVSAELSSADKVLRYLLKVWY